jgi:LacI family transcriptional regulator
MRAGAKKTSVEIAAALGVSQSTVSRALNNSPLITDAVKESVLAKARELGYIRNHLAKSLATGKSGIIGVLASGLQVDISGAKVIALDDEIRRRGFHPYITYTRSESELALVKASELVERGADGLILLGAEAYSRSDSANYNRILKLGVPTVIVTDTGLPNKCAQVVQSCDDACAEAVSYLIRSGRSEIFILWKRQTPEEARADHRLRTISETLKKQAGFNADNIIPLAASVPHPALSDNSEAIIQKQSDETAEFLRRARPAGKTAVICHNDMVAAGLLTTALKIGVRVPEDLMIVGYNNSSVSIYTNPQLTTISQSPEALAKETLELLEAGISRRGAAQTTVKTVPCKFIQRGT